MCGRFTLAVENSDLQTEFEGFGFPDTHALRYNIAPSQPILAIPNLKTRSAEFFVWGLIPSWAKDPTIGSRLINARAETAAEKPAFRASYRHKRCIIPADGFYEWMSVPGSRSKVPHYLQLADGRPFGIAGLWSEWHAPDGSSVRTCTILTTAPNSLIAPIHNRMPVILAREDRSLWLNPAALSAEALTPVLKSYPAGLMRAYPVSTRVNNPAYDDEQCRLPA